MIFHHCLYLKFLVGLGRLTPHSVGCYIGYLESVSLWLEADITPELIHSEATIEGIGRELLKKEVKISYISNYQSAMRAYLRMARAHNLSESQSEAAPSSNGDSLPIAPDNVGKVICDLVRQNPSRSKTEIAAIARSRIPNSNASPEFVADCRAVLTAAGILPQSSHLAPVGKKICELIRQNPERRNGEIAAEVRRILLSRTPSAMVAKYRYWLRCARSNSANAHPPKTGGEQ